MLHGAAAADAEMDAGRGETLRCCFENLDESGLAAFPAGLAGAHQHAFAGQGTGNEQGLALPLGDAVAARSQRADIDRDGCLLAAHGRPSPARRPRWTRQALAAGRPRPRRVRRA